MESHPPLHLGVVAIEKGAFGSSLTKVASFNLLIKHYVIKMDLIRYYFLPNSAAFKLCNKNIFMYLPYPSATKLIFKLNKAAENLAFSFFQIGCLTNAQGFSLSFYLFLAAERKGRFMPFSWV